MGSPDPERAKRLAAEAARRSESFDAPATGLMHTLQALREAMRRRNLYALLPFLPPLRAHVRARTDRLRCQLAALGTAGCAELPAMTGNLLAVAVFTGALAVSTAFALPPALESFAAAPVATVVHAARDVAGPAAPSVDETTRTPAARATSAAISSSFEVRPGPAPARAGGSVTTERGIRIDVDRTFYVGNDERNVTSIDHSVWIYCDPQSQVKQALCGAYDTASASSTR